MAQTQSPELKRINLINWILIGVYAVICIVMVIGVQRSTTDAAGKGMAMGFAMVYGIYVVLLALLNLIPARWMKYVVLVMAVIPVAWWILGQLSGSAF